MGNGNGKCGKHFDKLQPKSMQKHTHKCFSSVLIKNATLFQIPKSEMMTKHHWSVKLSQWRQSRISFFFSLRLAVRCRWDLLPHEFRQMSHTRSNGPPSRKTERRSRLSWLSAGLTLLRPNRCSGCSCVVSDVWRIAASFSTTRWKQSIEGFWLAGKRAVLHSVQSRTCNIF